MTGYFSLNVFLAGLALCVVMWLVWRRNPPLPPGPPGWPFIGSVFDIPTYAPYKTLGAMSSIYGPVITVRVFGKPFILLNSFKTAKDLLETQSAVTSNKPHFTLGSELVGWNNSTPFLQYGKTLRKHRKLFYQHIGNKSGLAAFYPIIEVEAKRFICNVLKNPGELRAHCRRTVASCVFKISYGYNVKDDGGTFQDAAVRASQIMHDTVALGRYVVDIFPILRYLPEWFPGCGFHKDAKRWRKIVSDAVNMPHEFVLEHLAKGDAVPSLVSRTLQECQTPEDEEILKWASFSIYLGGIDTTPAILLGFFSAMTMYPEVHKRAQAELDAVVGNARLPTMEDCDTLPYVNAICTEILRWNAPIPIMARVSTQSIVHEGHLIPKGSWLLSNIWFMLSNPETYPDPERFDPERFLGEHQQPDPREACFGWGRRQCPGARLADSLIFIYVATALATLDISRHVEDGAECLPKIEFNEGILRHVKPFKCTVTLRSKKAEDLLQTGSE